MQRRTKLRRSKAGLGLTLTSRFTLNLISVLCGCALKVFSELELRPLFPCCRIPQASLQLSGVKPRGCKAEGVQMLWQKWLILHITSTWCCWWSQVSHQAADSSKHVHSSYKLTTISCAKTLMCFSAWRKFTTDSMNIYIYIIRYIYIFQLSLSFQLKKKTKQQQLYFRFVTDIYNLAINKCWAKALQKALRKT